MYVYAVDRIKISLCVPFRGKSLAEGELRNNKFHVVVASHTFNLPSAFILAELLSTNTKYFGRKEFHSRVGYSFH